MAPENVKAANGGAAVAIFQNVLAWTATDVPEDKRSARIIKLIMRRSRVSERAAHVIAELANIGGAVRL